MKIGFTLAALEEARAASDYYEAQQRGLGSKFLDEVEFALDRIVSPSYRVFPSFDEAPLLPDPAISFWSVVSYKAKRNCDSIGRGSSARPGPLAVVSLAMGRPRREEFPHCRLAR